MVAGGGVYVLMLDVGGLCSAQLQVAINVRTFTKHQPHTKEETKEMRTKQATMHIIQIDTVTHIIMCNNIRLFC